MHIGIMGAGAIGCYLGGCLHTAGQRVTLIGRPWMQEHIQTNGLRISRHNGPTHHHVLSSALQFHTTPAALTGCDVVLVTVKNRDTPTAAQQLGRHLSADTAVISFQNGLHNHTALQAALPQRTVLAGMVPFYVGQIHPGHFHQATTGTMALSPGPQTKALMAAFRTATLTIQHHSDMPGVLWTKLLFNLNNAINALCDLPLQQQLAERQYRLLTAAAMAEGLAVLRRAAITPRRIGTMIPSLAVRIMRLPNWAFVRMANSMIQMDPTARSSMWDDLQRRRRTEIDDLNGEVVALGERIGHPTPINTHLCALIRHAEREEDGSPGLKPDALWPTTAP